MKPRFFLPICIATVQVLSTVALGDYFSRKRILILSWNCESGGNAHTTIAKQLADFEGYDLIGLTEVKEDNADAYVAAAGVGEGAKGNKTTDFRHVLSDSGRGDRMAIIWDNKRFEKIGQPQELDNLNDPNMYHRSPLYARFKLRQTDIEFLFMVNHLARGDELLRQRQATGLKTWAASQQLPVIAVGDYNFDYNIDDGIGNPAMGNMLSGNVWNWIVPDRIYKTSASDAYNGLLDFIFMSHKPSSWKVDSRIITEGFPSSDDSRRSDHRPLEGRILIPN